MDDCFVRILGGSFCLAFFEEASKQALDMNDDNDSIPTIYHMLLLLHPNTRLSSPFTVFIHYQAPRHSLFPLKQWPAQPGYKNQLD